MEWWESIRRRVQVEGVSKRQIMRETGIHWETLKKILAFSSPPGYRLAKPRPGPKVGPFRDRIREILEKDKTTAGSDSRGGHLTPRVRGAQYGAGATVSGRPRHTIRATTAL